MAVGDMRQQKSSSNNITRTAEDGTNTLSNFSMCTLTFRKQVEHLCNNPVTQERRREEKRGEERRREEKRGEERRREEKRGEERRREEKRGEERRREEKRGEERRREEKRGEERRREEKRGEERRREEKRGTCIVYSCLCNSYICFRELIHLLWSSQN
ncbi:hypothetical protein GRJ2_001199300 [Grus japonensis]|uniref:Uncharacterized protein n=1 Tax=Grus japonensis TaxID=30415 RepID=A0ABC9WPV5_GRUJA